MKRYRLEDRVVDGQVVQVKVYALCGRRAKQVIGVKGSARGVGGQYLAHATGQVLQYSVYLDGGLYYTGPEHKCRQTADLLRNHPDLQGSFISVQQEG